MTISVRRTLAAGILFASLTACGGGGGGGTAASPPPPPPSPPAGPSWTQGVFPASTTFEDRCATPRTGNDAQGRPFPDQAGTLAHELFWLRSWTRETYLWNTEVADQNPASFTSRTSYFDTLKTMATTASGRPKDQFHFSMATADYLAQQTSAPQAEYGAEIRAFATTPPRDVRVIYTQQGTPATELLNGTPKLARGARILNVDGVDVVNGGSNQAQLDILNNGLFPRTAGETHTLVVRYADNSERTITLTSAAIVETPVNRSAVIVSNGKVGYILLNTFSPFSTEKALVDTIANMKSQGVNDVVLDLRYNGGGLLAIASQLSYMIAGPARTASPRFFERLRFNDAAGNTNPVSGGANTPTPFFNSGLGFSVAQNAPIQSLDLPRVYILSTSLTCSASESVINGLRGVDVEVVLIGATTCGKPYGFFPADNCGQTYFSIQFQGINNKLFGDYADGFAPANSSAAFPVKIAGCAVADDFTHELGDPDEAMLAAALGHRANGSCPAPPANSQGTARIIDDKAPAIEATGRSDAEEILRNTRDLTMPPR